jgi:hypothetical protein
VDRPYRRSDLLGTQQAIGADFRAVLFAEEPLSECRSAGLADKLALFASRQPRARGPVGDLDVAVGRQDDDSFDKCV